MCIHYRRSFLKLVDVEALKNINPSYAATAKLIGDKYYCFNNMAEDRQACMADTAEMCHRLCSTSFKTSDSFFTQRTLNIVVFYNLCIYV